jgi:predicted nucleic-acid-binding Zn-ribbon protein
MSEFSEVWKHPSPGSAVTKIHVALNKLRERRVTNDYCPRCGTRDWSVDLLDIPASSALDQSKPRPLPFLPTSPVESNLSLLTIVCKNCGYSIFHNLRQLGL